MTCSHCGGPADGRYTRRGSVLCGECFSGKTAAELGRNTTPVEVKVSDECYTPKWVFDAMGLAFDMDVAAPLGGPWHVPCARYLTAEDDGLATPWEGLVWCNPPYSKFRPWVDKWAEHPTGVLMGTYAPERYATVDQLGAADAVAFISCKFERPSGDLIKPMHGIAVAFRGVGVEPAERLAAADRFGAVMYGRRAA